jgi:RNA-binding protein 23/39
MHAVCEGNTCVHGTILSAKLQNWRCSLCVSLPQAEMLPSRSPCELTSHKKRSRIADDEGDDRSGIQSKNSRDCGRSLGTRLYVGNLHYCLKEEDVRQAFLPFGSIAVEMPVDAGVQHHKGFAFIAFESQAARDLALHAMNGMLLCGRRIKVSVPATLGPVSGQALQPPISKASSVANAAAAAAAAVASAGAGLFASELSTPAMSSRTSDDNNLQPVTPVASRVIALYNLLPARQPPDDSLVDEIREECSRYGLVFSVRMAFECREFSDSEAQAVAFVRFGTASAAASAARALSGRFFDGRRVTARLCSEEKGEDES